MLPNGWLGRAAEPRLIPVLKWEVYTDNKSGKSGKLAFHKLYWVICNNSVTENSSFGKMFVLVVRIFLQLMIHTPLRLLSNTEDF